MGLCCAKLLAAPRLDLLAKGRAGGNATVLLAVCAGILQAVLWDGRGFGC